MIMTSAKKTVVLMLLLMVFSTAAFAVPLENFRLRISDGNVGVVISDNDTGVDGFGNFADMDSTVGVISTGLITIGDMTGSVTFAMSQPDFNGVTVLTLQSTMVRFGPANRLVITLEDTGYTPFSSPSTFTGQLSVTSLESGTASFQTWVNRTNVVPDFGASTFPAGALDPENLEIPLGSAALFVSPNVTGVTGPIEHQELGYFEPGSDPYALFSQAVIDFDPTVSSGNATFTLTSTISDGANGRPLVFQDAPTSNVPEPTSLLLLGSGLVTLGLLRKKRTAA